MSESKEVALNVFRVVDRRRNVHAIQADRMVTDGDVVIFRRFGCNSEIASFSHPISAARADKSTYTEWLDLTPGEVCVSAFPAAPRGLVGLGWFVGLGLAATAALRAYELFGFAG